MLTRILLSAVLLALPASSFATIYMDTSFETCASGTGNDFPHPVGCEGWTDFDQEDVGHLRVTTEQAFSGTKSVKLTSDTPPGGSVNPTNRPSIYTTFPETNHPFLRMVIRQNSGFVLPSTGATKIFRFRPRQTANDPAPGDGLGSYPIFWFYNYFNTWAVNIEQPCDNLPGGFWIQGPAPRPDQWDNVEVEIIMNTGGLANGGMRIWVNNVLAKEVLNRKWVSATPNGTCPGGLWHPSDWSTNTGQLYNQAGNGVRYFDRIAIGNERIGIVGSPPQQDTTPPTPPTSLTAQ